MAYMFFETVTSGFAGGSWAAATAANKTKTVRCFIDILFRKYGSLLHFRQVAGILSSPAAKRSQGQGTNGRADEIAGSMPDRRWRSDLRWHLVRPWPCGVPERSR